MHSAVKYDLIGKLAEETKLTRATIAAILTRIKRPVFAKYQANPEDFLRNAARIINEQKGHSDRRAPDLQRHRGELRRSISSPESRVGKDFTNAVKTDRHIYDYVFTDSENERTFVELARHRNRD